MVPLHGKWEMVAYRFISAEGPARWQSSPSGGIVFFISPFVKSGDLRMKSLVRISGEQL